MSTVRVSVDLELEPGMAFDLVVEELASALARCGLRFHPGPGGGIETAGFTVGQVVSWNPGRSFALEWRAADWSPEDRTEVELRVEPGASGSVIALEHRGWGRLTGESAETAGWFADAVLAPLLRATTPEPFGDWLTDRNARRPSGAAARATYRDPLYHYPNFKAILLELELRPDDHVLEVGCGGGALLKLILQSGCRAAAIDHSPDMVRLAREENAAAIAAGRLEIREARADALPFADSTFTSAVMTGVLGFLPDPVAALAEMRRVLVPGGRIVVMGTDPELKGTPGTPEPMASRLRFHECEDLERIGRAAGFAEVRAVRRDLEAFAREVGVPDEHLPLFAGPGSRFLLATKR